MADVARHAPTAPDTAPPLPEMLAVLPAATRPPRIAAAERALREDVHVELDGEGLPIERVTLPWTLAPDCRPVVGSGRC